LLSFAFRYVPGVTEQYPAQISAGAFIHTNSWGSPFTGAPFYFGSDIDLFLYQNPVMLHLEPFVFINIVKYDF
jgi:hypothetical protein